MFQGFQNNYGMNPVNPYPQNPYMERLQGLQQPQMYPAQITPQNGLIRVTGIEGAKAYQMGPNGAVALFDANEDVFYVKTTDGATFPTIRAFRFSPIEEPQTQPAEYVTRPEFEELKGMIANVQQLIQQPTEPQKPARRSKPADSE